MAAQLEVTGLGIDDAANVEQRRYTFDLWSSSKIDPPTVLELDDFLHAWYMVGFHGGMGGWMNQFKEATHEETNGQWHVRFSVVGVVTHQALAVLLRCLDISDMHLDVERVQVDVAAYD